MFFLKCRVDSKTDTWKNSHMSFSNQVIEKIWFPKVCRKKLMAPKASNRAAQAATGCHPAANFLAPRASNRAAQAATGCHPAAQVAIRRQTFWHPRTKRAVKHATNHKIAKLSLAAAKLSWQLLTSSKWIRIILRSFWATLFQKITNENLAADHLWPYFQYSSYFHDFL